MRRTVITSADAARIAAAQQPRTIGEALSPGRQGNQTVAPPVVAPDNYSDRLMKYIPADVIAFYLSLDGIVLVANTTQAGAPPIPTLRWAVFVGVTLIMPVYLRRVANIEKRLQIVICTAAFVVWALTLPGTFFPWGHQVYPALLLPVFTFLIPLVRVEARPGEQITGT